MKVIVAGGRDFNDYHLLKENLDNFQQQYGNITEVVSGTAIGVDKLGEWYANENNIQIKRFIPDWKWLGKKAGFVRNRQMGDYAKERFACVISRHCQTMSERQAVLQLLASEKSELSAYAESLLAEQKAAPSPDSASASPE